MYERSYHAHVLKEDTSAKRPFPWKRICIIAGIVALVTGIVFVIRIPQFQIRVVTVEGTHVADPTDVSQFVLGELQGAHLWVLPKTSVFLSSPKVLGLRIHERFPRFKEVLVKRDSMHSLSVVVEEYPGVYLWCDSTDACSFMDETGTVFADAPYFSGSAYLKVYVGNRQPYPFHPITEHQIGVLKTLVTGLETMEINPVEIRFENEHTVRMVFFHNTARSDALFDPTRAIDNALQVLYSGLRTDPLQKLYHDHTKVLKYLDLRFSNKVVYKFD